MKIAALDFGTNSFLCLISEVMEGGTLRVLHDESVVVRLGQELQKTGRIHPDALQRAEECLKGFVKTIESYKVQMVQAVATAAAREAENSDELYRLCEKYNISIKTISGKQEAIMSFQGTVSNDELERCLLIDVGGGSTEYIIGNSNQIDFSISLPYGAVRLTEKYITRQPVEARDEDSLRSFIQARSEEVWAQLDKLKPKKVLAVAGTPTSLVASILGKFDAKVIDGYRLDGSTLAQWVENFRKTSVEEKKLNYNLGARADIIFAGSVVLEETLKRLKIPELYVSTKGIRYGLAYQMVHEHRANLKP